MAQPRITEYWSYPPPGLLVELFAAYFECEMPLIHVALLDPIFRLQNDLSLEISPDQRDVCESMKDFSGKEKVSSSQRCTKFIGSKVFHD